MSEFMVMVSGDKNRCPYCHDDLGGEAFICEACHTPYHADCWREYGCTTLGCVGHTVERSAVVEKSEPSVLQPQMGDRWYVGVTIGGGLASIALLLIMVILVWEANGSDPVARERAAGGVGLCLVFLMFTMLGTLTASLIWSANPARRT